MQHLFSPEGDMALAAILRERPLLAFDFDGTLAPIVSSPGAARLSKAVSQRLASLSHHLPVAIVSGRAVSDLHARLGFTPRYVVGNHGAEDAERGSGCARAPELDVLRHELAARRAELDAAGVRVEDKGMSIALHYRLAAHPLEALAMIRSLRSRQDGALRVFGGKMVENVMPAGAPDKARAVHELVLRSRAATAVFAGDDLNDEPVFAAAPASWLTIRVGRDHPDSRARFFLDSPVEVAMLLERMLAHMRKA